MVLFPSTELGLPDTLQKLKEHPALPRVILKFHLLPELLLSQSAAGLAGEMGDQRVVPASADWDQILPAWVPALIPVLICASWGGSGAEDCAAGGAGGVLHRWGRKERKGGCWLGFVLFWASRGTARVWCGAHGELSFILGRKNARGLSRNACVSFQWCISMCAAFLRVTEEELHQSAVACLLCSAVQVCSSRGFSAASFPTVLGCLLYFTFTYNINMYILYFLRIYIYIFFLRCMVNPDLCQARVTGGHSISNIVFKSSHPEKNDI